MPFWPGWSRRASSFTRSTDAGSSDPAQLYRHTLSTLLPRPSDDVDPRLRPILAALLAKDPASRPPDADTVVAMLCAALDQAFALETVATRESFLQAGPLVGRDAEVAQLTTILQEARRGRGRALLVAGESGVGKTRLLDELRTRALIDSVHVARGQASAAGGGPYHVWRDVVRSLLLRVDLGDAHTVALRAIEPDVDQFLARALPAGAPASPEAAQSSMFLAVEQLLRRQPDPVLVILEDLHWVGSESLELFGWISRVIDDLPILLIGSHRDDEAPHLPQAIGAPLEVLRLGRLGRRAVAEIADAMIGGVADRDDLIALLERETEGIPFFIVEVVRTLAENARGLARIGHTRLPERVLSGGMRKMIRRRLDRLPPDALDAVLTAACAGRAVSRRLIEALHAGVEFDRWTDACADAAVLEFRDDAWRFAHDKVREQLLADTPEERVRARHAAIAEAIERLYGFTDAWVTALATHWHQAGLPERERPCRARAGILALQNSACREAVVPHGRAVGLQVIDGAPDLTEARRADRCDAPGRGRC
jgi:predicted ATPase